MGRFLGLRAADPHRGRLSNPAKCRSRIVPPTFDRAKGGVASASVALKGAKTGPDSPPSVIPEALFRSRSLGHADF